jgi:hypothetical protein
MFMSKLQVVFGLACFGVLCVLFVVLAAFDVNEPDEITVLRHMGGEIEVVSGSGYYFTYFGSRTTYDKFPKINFSTAHTAIGVRFQGTETGTATGVAVFSLPLAQEKMTDIHKTYGSPASLINDLLNRQVVKCAKASSRVMTVEEHYTGGAGQMSGQFKDQLEQGVIVTDRIEGYEARENKEGQMVQTLIIKVVSRLMADGVSLQRNSNPLEQYGITVMDASIEEVDYEPKVDQRLDAQKEMASKERLATQRLKTAQQEAKTAKAEGEKAIAEAQALADKEKIIEEMTAKKLASVAQIKADQDKKIAVIIASQQVEVAQQATLEETEKLAKDKIIAEGLKVQAEARKTAGQNALDPQFVFEQKLKAEVEMERLKWEAIGKIQLPEVYQSSGGSASSSADPVQNIGRMLQLESLMNLKDRVSPATN